MLNRLRAAALIGLLFALFLVPRTRSAEPAPALLLKNITLYTVTADEPIRNGLLLVKDGKIVYAGPADDVACSSPPAPRSVTARRGRHPRPGRHALAHRHLPPAESRPTPTATR